MRVFHFSENPYPDGYDKSTESLRITLPNRHFDPEVGHRLLNRYIDEWVEADELGLNIMVNEHHSTTTSLTVSNMLPLAILARETKKARLLALGAPLGLRADPVAVAEELAWIDVLSGGRLEIGLVKGFGSEMAPANQNPATADGRFREASELVPLALSHRDGPFRWEGDHFQYRQVNIWPAPLQQPHPPIWRTVASSYGARDAADMDVNIAAGSAANVREVFDTYRARMQELDRPAPSEERFGFLTYVAVGASQAEAERKLRILMADFEARGLVPTRFAAPPGFLHFTAAAGALKHSETPGPRTIKGDCGRPIMIRNASREELVRAQICFAGDPDQVFEQIRSFYEKVGGFGTLLAQMQGGALSHADTVDTLRRFSADVLPRLQQLTPPDPVSLERNSASR